MKLVARTFMVTVAAGTLFVGPTTTAFAAGADHPVAADAAPADLEEQINQAVQQFQDQIDQVAEQLADASESLPGSDTSTDSSTSADVPAAETSPAQPICDGATQVSPELGDACATFIGQLAAPPGGEDPGEGETPLDPVTEPLQPLLDVICQILAQINAQLPEEFKLSDLTAQIINNEQLKPLMDQIPQNVKDTLLIKCGTGTGGEPTPTATPTEDRPAPVREATLPKTGGAPLWLIPMGLFLVALGSKLVWPVAEGR